MEIFFFFTRIAIIAYHTRLYGHLGMLDTGKLEAT